MRRDRAERPELRLAAGLALVAGIAASSPVAQEAGERSAIDNRSELRTALQGCWRIPAETEGSVIAFRFGLGRCVPVPVTPSFGAILGESPIVLRFVDTPPGAAYRMNSDITIVAPP